MHRNAADLAEHQAIFAREGVLILRDFFAAPLIDRVQAATDQAKRDRPRDVVIDNLHNGDRTVLGLMSPAQIQHDRMKINDLYLNTPEVRELALAEPLVAVLRALLGDIPVLCNSLYLERSSMQEPHVDALYMTPRTPGHLIAAWIALRTPAPAAASWNIFPAAT